MSTPSSGSSLRTSEESTHIFAKQLWLSPGHGSLEVALGSINFMGPSYPNLSPRAPDGMPGMNSGSDRGGSAHRAATVAGLILTASKPPCWSHVARRPCMMSALPTAGAEHRGSS